MDQLKQSVALNSLTEEFDAYYLPGGHGTAVDFPHNEKLQGLLSMAWKNGKVLSSVCHGPIGKSPRVPVSPTLSAPKSSAAVLHMAAMQSCTLLKKSHAVCPSKQPSMASNTEQRTAFG